MFRVLLAGLLFVVSCLPAFGDGLEEPTRQFINHLAKSEFAEARAGFDGTMLKAMPEPRLKAVWEDTVRQHGAFLQIEGVRFMDRAPYRLAFATVEFERSRLDLQLTWSKEQKISGLFLLPAPPKTAPLPAAEASHFTEIDVSVGEGPAALGATLTVPSGAGPFPAAVLVHGSGPHDRDETVGPSKPFRDLAHGLANRGVVVLRYEKGTYAHQNEFVAKLPTLTIHDEVTSDALAAVELLAKRPEVRADRVFVVGHSLGAAMAPWIAESSPRVAGVAMLAAPYRRFEDVLIDQMNTILGDKAGWSDAQRAEYGRVEEAVERIRTLEEKKGLLPHQWPLGLPPSYWLTLREATSPEVAVRLEVPVLIVQGGRDYQVSAEKDYGAWESKLADRKNVECKLYPRLNHLLIAGDGASTPTEYTVEGRVDQAVINDLADWIKRQ